MKDYYLLTVAFSKQRRRWWCCSSKMSSSRSQRSSPFSSMPNPDSWAKSLDSTAFFLDRNAAPEVALASRMRANRAFCIFNLIINISSFNNHTLRTANSLGSIVIVLDFESTPEYLEQCSNVVKVSSAIFHDASKIFRNLPRTPLCLKHGRKLAPVSCFTFYFKNWSLG